MPTASLTETDIRVRSAVLHQLDWDPEVDASAVGVAAKDAVVTLTGYVDSYAAQFAAERAAKRVHGVRGVANDIEVRPMLARIDADIASDAVRALEARGTVPHTVHAVIRDGYVTLTGRVSRLFQRQDAHDAMRQVRGIRGVFNHIEIAPRAASGSGAFP